MSCVPAGVQANRHTADTSKPYDPALALGDIHPTTPQPQKQDNKCGVFGAILLAVVAVAVTVLTKGAAIKFAAGLFGKGAAATIAGGAIAGAAGSVASQGLGVATGIQDKFSWKGVGMAALGGAVGGALGEGGAFGESGLFSGVKDGVLRAGLQGAAGSALTQGIGVATRLQDKFSFVGVAAAGIGAMAGGALSGQLKGDPNSFGNTVATSAASGLANAATRSALEGTSFGRNIVAAIPDVIGQAVGGALGRAVYDPTVAARRAMESNPVEQAQLTLGEAVTQRIVAGGGSFAYDTDGNLKISGLSRSAVVGLLGGDAAGTTIVTGDDAIYHTEMVWAISIPRPTRPKQQMAWAMQAACGSNIFATT